MRPCGMRQSDFSPSLRNLASLVSAAFAGETACAVPVSNSLAEFAIRRHRIGPLILTAIRDAPGAPQSVLEMLREDARGNARKYTLTLTTSAAIGQGFAQARIPALLFKGLPLAQALYVNPASRHVGDIDILIPPSSLRVAREVLNAIGFESADTLFALPGPLQEIAIRSARDFLFANSKNRQKLELHTRLIFSKRVSAGFAAQSGGLVPKLGDGNALAVPEIGPVLAHYLLLHGAASGWARMKWLADLLPLLAKLSADQRRALADCAERTRTAAATKAGLVLLRSIFEGVELGPLKSWLEEPAGRNAVETRVRKYAAWLQTEAESAPNPLQDRASAFTSAMLLNDRLADQAGLLLPAAFSSTLRIAGRLAARA